MVRLEVVLALISEKTFALISEKKILFQRTNTEVKEIACVALHLFW